MKNFLINNILGLAFLFAVVVVFVSSLVAAPYYHDHKEPPVLLGMYFAFVTPSIMFFGPVLYALFTAEKSNKDAKKVLTQFAVKVVLTGFFGVFAWRGFEWSEKLLKYPFIFWDCVGGFFVLLGAMFCLFGVVTVAALKFPERLVIRGYDD